MSMGQTQRTFVLTVKEGDLYCGLPRGAKVLSARYEKWNDSSQGADLKIGLLNKLQFLNEPIKVNNDSMWGDAVPGQPKHLVLKYSCRVYLGAFEVQTKRPDNGTMVSKIVVRTGDLIDAIEFFYEEDYRCAYAGNLAGGKEEPPFRLLQRGDNADDNSGKKVEETEYITEIVQKSGDHLNSVMFVTSLHRGKKFGGDGGDKYTSFKAPPDHHIVNVELNEFRYCPTINRIVVSKI